MRRFVWLFFFLIPISGQFLLTDSPLFAQVSMAGPMADSLDLFFQSRDARKMLVEANRIVHEQPDRARLGFDMAARLASEKADWPLVSVVYRDKGLFFEELNRLDSALLFYEKTRRIVDSLHLEEGLLTIYNDLAILHRKLGQYRESRKNHFSALELAEQTGDREMIEFSYHGLGALYEMVGDSSAALDFYLKSQHVARERGSIEGQIITLKNIARTYTGLRDEANALLYIRQALQLVEKQGDTLARAETLSGFGDVLHAFGRSDEALGFFRKSGLFYELSHEPANAIGERMKEAHIFSEKNDPARALQIWQDCLQRADVLAANQLVEIHLEIGKLLAKTGDPTRAEAAFQASLAVCETNRLARESVGVFRAMHQFFTDRNAPEKALVFLKKANDRNDSLAISLAEQGHAELEFRYDQEQNQRTLQQLRLRENRLILFAVLVLGAFLAGFLGWVIRLRRRANAALQSKNLEIEGQNLRLRESNSFLQQFTWAVAHDLKAPLRTIGSFIQVLEQKFGSQFSTEAHEYMAFVTGGVRRMDSLLMDLLEYSKISSQRPGSERIDPKFVIEEVRQRLSKSILEKDAYIEVAEQLPDLPMEKAHLTVLFQHLIANGLKFNHSEKPFLRISGLRENGHVRFSVEDNGIGIDPTHGHKIFELFHQLHKNKGFEGTGIGLTVCKNIVDKYEGRIWFEPVGEGNGSRFWVELPG